MLHDTTNDLLMPHDIHYIIIHTYHKENMNEYNCEYDRNGEHMITKFVYVSHNNMENGANVNIETITSAMGSSIFFCVSVLFFFFYNKFAVILIGRILHAHILHRIYK